MTNKKMYKKLKKKLKLLNENLLYLQDIIEECDLSDDQAERETTENDKEYLLINNVSDEQAAQITAAMLEKHGEFACYRTVNSGGKDCYSFIITGADNIEIYKEIMLDLSAAAESE